MTDFSDEPAETTGRLRNRAVALAAGLALALTLGACDTTRDVVDAANPVNWFEDEETPEDASTESAEAEPVPGEEEDFPNLSTVPDEPEEPEIQRRYDELREGLVADRENARYADEELRRQAPPDRDRTANAQAANENALADPPDSPPEPASVAEAESRDAPASEPAPAPEPQSAPEPVAAADAESQSAEPAPAPEPVAAAEAEPQSAEPAPESAASLAGNEGTRTSASGAGASDTGGARADTRTQSGASSAGSSSNEAEDPEAEGRLIATIYFDSGSSRLTSRDREILREVAAIYQDGGTAVRVVGHSSKSGASGDETQQALVNYKASLDRASSVAEALAEFGVPRGALSIDARGAKQPRYAETTQAGQAGNRRAEVYIAF